MMFASQHAGCPSTQGGTLRDLFIDAYLEPLIIGSFVAGRTGRGPVRPVAGIGQKIN
jgi:hypothetical protein